MKWRQQWTLAEVNSAAGRRRWAWLSAQLENSSIRRHQQCLWFTSTQLSSSNSSIWAFYLILIFTHCSLKMEPQSKRGRVWESRRRQFCYQIKHQSELTTLSIFLSGCYCRTYMIWRIYNEIGGETTRSIYLYIHTHTHTHNTIIKL